MPNQEKQGICLIGHPYAPIGMGEHVRSSWRAFKQAGYKTSIFDIYQLNVPEESFTIEFSSAQTDQFSEINIFHINGDEVEQVLDHLLYQRKRKGYNIIYPAWELERYPEEWARQLDRFDEIWAPSAFIQKALASVCKKPVIHMPLACEVQVPFFLGRRYFGIPEQSYSFLFFYDLRSYATRKNPSAVLDAYSRLIRARPYNQVCLVIKVNGADGNPGLLEDLRSRVASLGGQVVVIDRVMSDAEIKNLVNVCDCFVSLHRAEGFGRGLSESMILGKPVIGTGYSGNLDFMNEENSLLVPYELISLAAGEYPHWEKQRWANPNIGKAVEYMVRLLDAPELGYAIGRKGQAWIKKYFGYRTTGLRYVQRIGEILAGR